MRWLAIWLFLTAAWAAGWLISQAVLGATGFTLETAGHLIAHLIAIPLAQVAALWGVSRFRRMFRPQRPPDPEG